MKRLAAGLMFFAVATAADAQVVELRTIPAPPSAHAPAPPAPELTTISEAELRALLNERRLHGAARTEAIAVFRRRFTSAAARAFALNVEAQTHLDAWETDRAFAIYGRVRSDFGDSRDPLVQAEVAAAMQGQVQAIEAAEARADRGPLRPVTAESIDLDSVANRLRRDIVERYAEATEPAIRAIVFQERYNLAVSETIASGRHTDPPRFMSLIAEYEDSDHPSIQWQIGDILLGLGFFESDPSRAIGYYDEFLRRFGQRTDARWRSRVSDAYDNKRYHLEQLGENDAARRVEAEHWAWFERAFPEEE